MSFTSVAGRADSRGPITLGSTVATIVTVGQVSGATTLREQGAIVIDPADSDASRRYKLYFTAVIGGVPRVWVTFSPTGTGSWSAPVACVMGVGDRNSEDPEVVTDLNQRGTVYRTGGGLMVMYVEDNATSTIYAYTSADGVTWAQTASNPAIDKSTGWEAFLVGSPVARHDGTRYLVGYEGIAAGPGEESFGLAFGTTPDALTKSPANPLWRPASGPLAEALADNSIVVDSFFKSDDGKSIIFLVHSGIEDTAKMFRGRTGNLAPHTWVEGDITGEGPRLIGDTLRNDITLDNTNIKQIVTQPADDNSIITRALVGRGAYKLRTSPIKLREAGVFTDRTLRPRSGGAFLAVPAGYRAEVLADGPLAYWRFNEAAGATTLADETTVYPATPTGATLGVTGRWGNAVSYDGTDDRTLHTTLGNFGSLLRKSSIEFWIKTTTTLSGRNIYGVQNLSSNTALQCQTNTDQLGAAAAGKTYFQFRQEANVQSAFAVEVPALYDGNWHHVVVTRSDLTNPATHVVYVDGVSRTITYNLNANGNNFANLAYPLAFGARNNRGTIDNFSAVQLDEVAVYTSTLPESRVLAHYNAAMA